MTTGRSRSVTVSGDKVTIEVAARGAQGFYTIA